MNKRHLEIIHIQIKFCKLKKNQDIYKFITEMKQLYKKLEPHRSLE